MLVLATAESGAEPKELRCRGAPRLTRVTAIDDLVRLVPPPAVPVSASGDWQQVESRLVLRVPDDFKQMTGHYGRGQFAGFITPLTPFGPEDLLVRSARRLLDSERPSAAATRARARTPSTPNPAACWNGQAPTTVTGCAG